MGRKKTAEEETKKAPAEEKKADDKKEEEPEDTPLVKELKEVDDKYLALEREYEKERHKLKLSFEKKQKPFLEQRCQILTKAPEGEEAEATGTPACTGFWLQALKNHPAFDEMVQEWDEPVLEYLRDITAEDKDAEDPNAGFKLTFHFVENPYFSNEKLEKDYTTAEASPYTGEMEVKECKATEIDWKAGKDVTVEKVGKKAKGGGAKKAKQKAKEKAEPRESFFRNFFQNLKEGMDIPDDFDLAAMGIDEDEADEEELIGYIMENDHDGGCAMRDNIIPFAVRWYTGEAAPDDDDDDDEDEEEEDDDDDSEESDEDPPPKKKGGSAKKGGKPKGSPESKPADAPKEECKQQ